MERELGQNDINDGCGTPLTIAVVKFSSIYVLATREDAALRQLQQLLAPFSIGQFYTDSWGAYLRLLAQQHYTVGKANTQRIERKHLTLSYSD